MSGIFGRALRRLFGKSEYFRVGILTMNPDGAPDNAQIGSALHADCPLSEVVAAYNGVRLAAAKKGLLSAITFRDPESGTVYCIFDVDDLVSVSHAFATAARVRPAATGRGD